VYLIYVAMGLYGFLEGGEYYIYPICLRELIGRMSIFCVFVVSLGFFLLSFWGFLGLPFSFWVVALFGSGVFFVPFVCSLSCPRSFFAY
jgi:hypothetical protein